MALAYISEYAALAQPANGRAQAPLEPAMADQVVTTGATSAASAAFGTETNLISISTPAAQAVCVKFTSVSTGASPPTATTSNKRLPANSVFYFGVKPGDQVAFIDVT